MLISKKKFELESLFWTEAPYKSKVSLQRFDEMLDIYLIKYQVKDRQLLGLVMEPKGKTQKYPVIIHARGGNNTNPEAEKGDMGLKFPQLGAMSLFAFAEKGYVIYTSQLSGYGPNSGKDEFGGEDVNDLLALKELIEENPICDPNKVGILGYSRGGMMAYLALTKVSWLRTIAVVGAPTNERRGAEERPEMQKMYEVAFGGSEEEKQKRSILFNTSLLPKDANILILHGKADERVNYLDSVELAEKLELEGINHKLRIFEEGSHGLMENRQERDKEILEWFARYLS